MAGSSSTLAAAFAYRQLFSIVLLRTVKRAIDGKTLQLGKTRAHRQMSKRTNALTDTV